MPPNPFIFSSLIFIASLWMSSANFALAHEGKDHESQSSEQFSGLESEPGRAALRFHEALRTGSRDQILSALSDDVIIAEGGSVERSANEYAAGHLNADLAFMKGVTVDVLEHRVVDLDGTAWSFSRVRYVGTYEGEEVDFVGIETLVLQKENDNRWLITHIHWSD